MEVNLKQQYDAQGYTIARQHLSHDEIAQLTQSIDPIYDQWLADNQHAFIHEGVINMHSLTHPQYFKTNSRDRVLFFERIASKALTVLLNTLFGQGLYFHNTQLFFNPHNLDKQPYWHRDLQYSPIEDSVLAAAQKTMLALHVRIPLEPETGVELIPGTHNRWDTDLERNVRLERQGHNQHEELPGAVLISLQPGDVLIFDANMIHRGNYALNTTRKALDLCTGKPHPLTHQYFDPAGLPSDQELRQLSHPEWYQRAKSIGLTHPLNEVN